MTAPDRIWIDNERYEQHWHVGHPPTADRYTHVHGEYIRADLAPQWQDIATAPKDGTFILAFGNGVAIHNCHYIAEWSEGDGWICSYSDVDVTPSHWLPLPTPPEQAP